MAKLQGFAIAGATAFALAVTGCAASYRSEPTQPRSIIEGSLIAGPDSVGQLIRDSGALVEVTADGSKAVPADAAGTSGHESTVTTVQINKVVYGSVGALSTLDIRQTGTSSDYAPDFSPLLTPGQNYLLFVTPFTFSDGKPTGQWVLTDEAGEFAADASGSYILKSHNVGPHFPTTLTSDILQTALSRHRDHKKGLR